MRALQGHKDRWRPASGGVSIGHINITAGTLGCLATRDGELFILSNNHVLANSNAAQKGDPIIQAGRYDGGTLDGQIATLEDFEASRFGGNAQSDLGSDLQRTQQILSRLMGLRKERK